MQVYDYTFLSCDGWQSEVGSHKIVLRAGELLDRPDDRIAVGEVGHSSLIEKKKYHSIIIIHTYTLVCFPAQHKTMRTIK